MRSGRACLVVLLSTAALLFAVSGGEEVQEVPEQKVLSRQRRYLTFPEGSSLQVVYDQTIPIIGIPLMYTIGVTVAIAYELPSKPWYYYAKEIRKNIHNSAYLLRKDQNVSQLTYTDQALGQRPTTSTIAGATQTWAVGGLPAKANLLNVGGGAALNRNPTDYNKHPYYYQDSASVNPATGDKSWNRNSLPPVTYYSPNRPGPVAPAQWAPVATKLQPVSNKLGYYFGKNPNPGPVASVGNQLSQWMKYLPMNLNSKQPIYWSDVVKGISQLATKRKDYVTAVNQLPEVLPGKYGWKKGHRKPILPVFGKRSVDSHLAVAGTELAPEEVAFSATTSDPDQELEAELERLIAVEEEKHFTRHHRQTRHDLYAKIETSLNSKGLNGRECVLRTLCEAGHPQLAPNLPNTFAAEIIKTIFRLPKSSDEKETLANDVHLAYDLAHQSNADCVELYPDCDGDLWSHPLLY